MNIETFKNKIDQREFWGDASNEAFQAAYKWAEKVNQAPKTVCEWSWDCGLKLDYDGNLCSISSRFYPPHKSAESYGKWHGTIHVSVKEYEINTKKVEAKTLDELQVIVEKHVLDIETKITNSIKSIFK